MSKVSCTKLVYHLGLSYNSSGYEQTLCKKNIQLTYLKFYINTIVRCICIVDILSTRRQDYQSILSQVFSFFTSRSYINHKDFYIFQLLQNIQHVNKTARCISIVNILSERRPYHKCQIKFYINTLQGVLVYLIFCLQVYKIKGATLSTSIPSENSIIKAFNKPLIFYQFQSNAKLNQSLFLTVSPSVNT